MVNSRYKKSELSECQILVGGIAIGGIIAGLMVWSVSVWAVGSAIQLVRRNR